MTREEQIAFKADSIADECIAHGAPLKDYYHGFIEGAKWAYANLSRPSLPSNLNEAAEKIASDIAPTHPDIDWDECFEKIKDGIKAGAEWMVGQGVSLSHLIAWYIQSVDAHEPIWTEEHLEELIKDYILIPKK